MRDRDRPRKRHHPPRETRRSPRRAANTSNGGKGLGCPFAVAKVVAPVALLVWAVAR